MQVFGTGAQVKRLNIGNSALLALMAMIGCGEASRVRVSDEQLAGTYTATFDTGKEQLVLRPNRTYTQVFSSPAKQFANQGTWESRNEFLGGTVVELRGANLSEAEPPGAPFRYGTINLPVHRETGKLKLALKEAADFYYERTD